ncbi:hypothetical protein KDW_59780 [Dictyobacter vulcani]|uniref:Tc1-like transposase DDE domain-containing protein n=1 Tax=Dictyobacter vulcani TaxID=2607529 RepID=A0A5J4L2X0_9CHLR|nr:hypothetical protein KDW_59780 [Dictyobacter vulcani]
MQRVCGDGTRNRTCQVRVSKRRTKKDWALFLREIIDVQYPHADKIVLVMDNLNTHTPLRFTRRLNQPRPAD